MAKRRNLIGFGGVGSTSRSLGARDPRIRRNATSIGASDVSMGGRMRVDKNHRLIADVPVAGFVSEATSAEQTAAGVQVNLNKVIASLKTAGLMNPGEAGYE